MNSVSRLYEVNASRTDSTRIELNLADIVRLIRLLNLDAVHCTEKELKPVSSILWRRHIALAGCAAPLATILRRHLRLSECLNTPILRISIELCVRPSLKISSNSQKVH